MYQVSVGYDETFFGLLMFWKSAPNRVKLDNSFNKVSTAEKMLEMKNINYREKSVVVDRDNYLDPRIRVSMLLGLILVW